MIRLEEVKTMLKQNLLLLKMVILTKQFFALIKKEVLFNYSMKQPMRKSESLRLKSFLMMTTIISKTVEKNSMIP